MFKSEHDLINVGKMLSKIEKKKKKNGSAEGNEN
jgi:hypothetical protein